MRAAFAPAFAAVRRAGKSPIETADAPGFAVNRNFVPWVNDACRNLEEGVADVVLCGASEAPLFPTFADTFGNARALARGWSGDRRTTYSPPLHRST